MQLNCIIVLILNIIDFIFINFTSPLSLSFSYQLKIFNKIDYCPFYVVLRLKIYEFKLKKKKKTAIYCLKCNYFEF